jgi:hypothetical protein
MRACRSAKVFSQLLKIPSPVSTTLWSGGSPGHGSLSATAAAVLSSPGAGSTFSPHSSPIKAAAVMGGGAGSMAGGGGSPMMSKYAALLHGLN